MILHLFPAQLEKEDLKLKLGQLSQRVDEVKVDVYELLEKRYGSTDPLPPYAFGLYSKFQKTMQEMQEVSDRIENEVRIYTKQGFPNFYMEFNVM